MGPKERLLCFMIKINLSKKINGIHFDSELTANAIPSMMNMKWTRAMGIGNLCYDPLGSIMIH